MKNKMTLGLFLLFNILNLISINGYTKTTNSNTYYFASPRTLPTSITGFSAYSDYGGHRYFKSTTLKTWKEAAKIADSLGGYLAIPNTLAEQTFIATYVGSTFHWLGLTDEKTEGTWLDVLGNIVSYFKWDAGQPDNAGDQDYAHTQNGSWNDALNSASLNFVIEFNGVETTTWTQISTVTKSFTANWTQTLAATDPTKQYKLVVSGTWGIANGIQHRDAAYEAPSTININTYFSNGNTPYANRACADGNNWYFNNACPPLVPTTPSTYSSSHIYEYMIGNGQVGGYPIAFTDANLGDNSGALTYTLFESTSSSNIVTATPGELSLTKVTSTKYLLNWTSNTNNPIKIYNIYRSSDNGLNYTIVGKSNTTSYIDSNLSASTSYKYKVTEINKYANNNASSAGLVNSIPFDLSTNDILSTITGTVNSATPSADRFGINNSAYSFNGTTSYIQYPNTVANMTQASTYSFSFWAKGSSAGSVLSKYFNLDAGKSQFHITLSDIYGNGTGGAGNGDRLGFTPALNTWDHYVVVLKDGVNNSKVYRNGNTTAIATGRLNYNASTSTTNLFVGRMTDGGSLNPLNGLVDDIKIYNRELLTTDVTNLYNSENSLNTLSESGFSNIETTATSVSSKRALYVNKVTGSNTNSGTNASPYATIQYALNQATEGDTVIISDHAYTESLNIISNLSNIVIGSKFIQDGDTAHTNAAIIDAVNTAWASIHISSTSGLTFYGVTLKNAKGRLLSAATDTIIFKNCKISNLGFNSSSITTNSIIAKNVYIDSTSIFNNVFIEGLITADSVSLTNSKFYSNQGGLIRNNGGGFSNIAAYIFNNSIFDNSRLMGGGSSMGDYFIHNVTRQTVIRNKIYRNNYMNILGGSSVGYQKVINNLFYKNSTSGAVARTVKVNSSDSLIMIHNTFIDNGTDFTAHPNGFWPGLIYNNIFNGNITFSGPSASGFDLITFKMKGNLFKTFPTFPQIDTTGSSENSVFTSIAFKDSVNLNFTYADTEPRLGNAAVITYPVYDDINGNPRPNPIGSKAEIGAFESPKSSVSPNSPVLNTIQTDSKRVTLNWSQANMSGVTKFKIYKDSATISGTSPINFTTGLVAYYPFTGSTFDSSGKGNTLTSTNVSLTMDRFGSVNSAYNFSGTNSYMQSSVLSQEITNRTYSAWVNLSDLSQSAGGLIGLQSSDAGIFDVVVYNESNEGWGFGSEYYSRNKYSKIKETSTSTWAMLTATYEPNLFKLYRNGILIDSTKSFAITRFGTTSKINIGLRHNTGYNPYLNGKIDDVRLYNRAISATEVANLYSYESKTYSERTSSGNVTIIPIDSVGSTIFTYTDNVSGFKKYFYRVTAVNASGVESDLSNELSSFVYDTVTLVSPISKITNSVVKPTFTWTTKTNATKYRLQVSTDSTFATVSYTDSIVTTNQFVCTKAMNSALNYYWRVKAGDALGYGAWSSISSLQTLYISPSLDSINVKDNVINIKWSHSDVTAYNKFNIYRDTATISGTTASLPTAITGFNPYQDHNGHRYFKSTTNKTFAEARRIADSLGGYLAIPNNKAENDFLKSLINSETWIGVTDEIIEGTWRDIFNNTLGYTNWNAGEPNNTSNNEDYASLIGFTTNPSFLGLWNDAPGTQNFKFIVEFNGTNPGQVLDPSLTTNLVAQYLFNGNVLDSSGTGAHGTIIGGAALTTDRFGVANKAYSFNGTSQYIEFPNTVANVTTSKPYSISVWINQISGTNILGKYHNLDAGLTQFLLNTNSVIGNGTNTLPFANPSSGWNHYVVILQSGTGNTKMYRNGVLLTSGTVTYNNAITVTKFVVGRISDGGYYDYFNGKIDDIRVYDKVLTASDVASLYNYENTNPLLRVSSNSGVRLIASTAKNIFTLSDTLSLYKKYYYRVSAVTADGKESDFSNELSATITPVTEKKEVCVGADVALSTTNSTRTWTQVGTASTKAMTTAWSSVLAATDPNKEYKMIVSGTWGIANSVRHRDPAYSSTNSSVAITASNSNPVANRGCDANWLFEGSCPPPIPSSPTGYSSTNTYEYLIGKGKTSGYAIAFEDGAYGDNTGSLTFTYYESSTSATTTKISTLTKAMTAGWSETLAASNPDKTYKMIVSGTWGVANSVRHRDPAYSSTNSSVAITASNSNPVANRGCDANWLFEGSCPPPVPSSPTGYSSTNTYEYLIGRGKSGGYSIAFSDGGYGDNTGSLTFDLYEISDGTWKSDDPTIATVSSIGVVTGIKAGATNVSYTMTNGSTVTVDKKNIVVNALPTKPTIVNDESKTKFCVGTTANISATATTGNTLNWYTTSTGGTATSTTPTIRTSNADTIKYYVSQTNSTTSCQGPRDTIKIFINPNPPSPIISNADWSLIGTSTKEMTAAWTSVLAATDPTKEYKMVVSGTWGIANSVRHRDPAYSSTNSSVAITASNSNPVANRGCDANWLFEGSCPPPVPSAPTGYSSSNTYEYLIGKGKAGGYSIAFEDGSYGDNTGALIFTLYQKDSKDINLYKESVANALSANALTGNTLKWYTSSTGGVGAEVAPTPITSVVDTLRYYVSQVNTASKCESDRGKITVIINPIPSKPLVSLPASNTFKEVLQPKFVWSKILNNNNYKLQVSTDSTFVSINIVDTIIADTQYVYNSSLLKNTNYYWRVQIADDNSFVTWLDKSKFQTIVNNPTADSVKANGNIVALNWSLLDTTNIKQFKIYRDVVPIANAITLDSALTKGLATYFTFNGNANDSSTNKNNGTVNGATLTTDRFGVANSAYLFNGTTNSITAATAKLPLGNSKRSFSFWVNYNKPLVAQDATYNDWTGILSYGSNSVSQGCQALNVWISPEKLPIGQGSSQNGENCTYVRADSAAAYGVWQNIVMTFGDSLRIYINGKQVSSKTSATLNNFNTTNNGTLYIGRINNNIATNQKYYLNGKLDDFRIYDKALTSSDVTNLYNFESTSPELRATSTVSVPKLLATTKTSVFSLIDTVPSYTKYYYRVSAINNDDIESDYSNELSVNTLKATNLLTPTNNQFNVNQKTSMTWEAVTNASKYQIQISTDSTFAKVTEKDTITTTASYSNFINFNTNTFYYWRVKAFGTNNNSFWSGTNKFLTNLPIPNFTTIKGGNKVDTLTWTYGDTTNIKNFKIYRGLTTNPTVLIDSVSASKTTYIDKSNLLLNTTYHYRIKAVSKDNVESEFSVSRSIVLVNKLPKAASLVSRIIKDAGEFNFTKVTINGYIGTNDTDGVISNYTWFVNDSLVKQKDSILTYIFKQGSNEIKLIVTDNDGGKDSSYADVEITAFIKKFKGGFLGGIAAVSPNLIYTADSTFDPSTGASVYLLDRSGKTVYPLVVSSKVFTTPSVASDSSVFITNGSNINGFNKTGAPLWSTIPLGGNSFVTPSIDSVLQRIYVGVSNKNFFAIDYKTGKIAWNLMTDAPINTSAVITGDRKLVFTSQSGTLYGFDIFKGDVQVNPKWKITFGDIITKSPAIDASNFIYIGTDAGRFIKLKLNDDGTNSIKWNVNLGRAILSSPVIDADGFVYVGLAGGDFCKIDPVNGNKIWTYNTTADLISAPFINEFGTIYIANKKGLVTALNANKRVLWDYQTDNAITSNILYAKGMLYFGSESGSFTAIYDDPNSVAVNNSVVGSIPNGNQNTNPSYNTTSTGSVSGIVEREPIWGTFQGNYRRTGSKPIDCPTKPLIASSNGTFAFCQGSSLKLSFADTVTSFAWRVDTSSTIISSTDKTITAAKAGNYKLSVTNIFGCVTNSDSYIVNEIPLPAAPVVNRNANNFLTSNYATGNKWYKDGVELSDTTQNFKPTVAGSYTVKTTQNTCLSTSSSPYYYFITDVVNLSNNQFIKINPNPFVSNITLSFLINGRNTLNAAVYEFTTSNKVWSKQNITSNSNLGLSNLPAGTYIIRVYSDDVKVNSVFKIIKL